MISNENSTFPPQLTLIKEDYKKSTSEGQQSQMEKYDMKGKIMRKR